MRTHYLKNYIQRIPNQQVLSEQIILGLNRLNY